MKIRNRSLDYKQPAVQSDQWSFVSNTPKSPTIMGFSRNSKEVKPGQIHILDKRKRKAFNELIRCSRGRNNPIKYEGGFQFLERWETLNKESDFHNVNYEFPQNVFSIIFNVLQLVQKIIIVWFVSFYQIYGLTQYKDGESLKVLINETCSKVIDDNERKDQYTKIKQLQLMDFSLKSITPRSYKRKYVNNKKYDQKHREQIIEKWKISQQSETLVFEMGKNFNSFFKRRNPSEVIKKLKRKDVIETQLTMIDETMVQFHTRKPHRSKLSCNL